MKSLAIYLLIGAVWLTICYMVINYCCKIIAELEETDQDTKTLKMSIFWKMVFWKLIGWPIDLGFTLVNIVRFIIATSKDEVPEICGIRTDDVFDEMFE